MIFAKNCETVSTFVEVMQKKLWPLFFRTRCMYVCMYFIAIFSRAASWGNKRTAGFGPRSFSVAGPLAWNSLPLRNVIKTQK